MHHLIRTELVSEILHIQMDLHGATEAGSRRDAIHIKLPYLDQICSMDDREDVPSTLAACCRVPGRYIPHNIDLPTVGHQ